MSAIGSVTLIIVSCPFFVSPSNLICPPLESSKVILLAAPSDEPTVISEQTIPAGVKVRSPVLAPVASVVANVTLSVDSSQPINILELSPLSKINPVSPLGAPVVPLPSSISLSLIVELVFSKVAVAPPDTDKLPVIVNAPLIEISPLLAILNLALETLPWVNLPPFPTVTSG